MHGCGAPTGWPTHGAGLLYSHPMACDEAHAQRIREVVLELVDDAAEVTEKKMFGGLAFLVRGHMAAAGSGSEALMVRCAPDRTAHHLANGAEPMVMRGSELSGWLTVPAGAVADDHQLEHWVGVGIDHVQSLPPKVRPRT